MPPPLEAIRKRLLNLADRAETPEQMSVINALQDAAEESTGSTQDRIETLKEALEFELVTDQSVINWTYLFQQLKGIMEHLGLPLGEERRRKRLCLRIFDGLFDSEDVAQAATILEKGIQLSSQPTAHPGGSNDSQGPASSLQHENRGNDLISAFNISKALGARWSDLGKYSGDIEDATSGVSFSAFRTGYVTATNELGVPHDRRADLVHHALKGRAHEFYLERIIGTTTQLSEVFTKLEAKFLDESTKLSIRSRLISMRLSTVVPSASRRALRAQTRPTAGHVARWEDMPRPR